MRRSWLQQVLRRGSCRGGSSRILILKLCLLKVSSNCQVTPLYRDIPQLCQHFISVCLAIDAHHPMINQPLLLKDPVSCDLDYLQLVVSVEHSEAQLHLVRSWNSNLDFFASRSSSRLVLLLRRFWRHCLLFWQHWLWARPCSDWRLGQGCCCLWHRCGGSCLRCRSQALGAFH